MAVSSVVLAERAACGALSSVQMLAQCGCLTCISLEVVASVA